jgi:hypothetical protein
MKKKNHLFFALAAGLFLTSVAGLAQTTITTLPYTITSPGVYMLGANLTNSANAAAAITIQASDVTLDLDGFYLIGNGQNGTAILVSDQLNITIKNGGIVGFNTAVILEGSALGTNYGHHVEGLNISSCLGGISLANGTQSIVANNQLTYGRTIGIYTNGFGNRIKNNDISGYRIGIRCFGGNYIQANFLNYCTTALWLGGDDRRKDNVVIRSANGQRGGDPRDQGQDE